MAATRRHVLYLLAGLGLTGLLGGLRGGLRTRDNTAPDGSGYGARMASLGLDLLIRPMLDLAGAATPIQTDLVVDLDTGTLFRRLGAQLQDPHLRRGARLRLLPVCDAASALVGSVPQRGLRHSLVAHLHGCTACQAALLTRASGPGLLLEHDVRVADLGRATLGVHPQHAAGVIALLPYA